MLSPTIICGSDQPGNAMRPINTVIAVSILLILSVSLNTCRKPVKQLLSPDAQLITRTIEVDGQTRRYALYVPPSIGNKPVPLVFSLHGGGIYIEDMTGESGYKTPYKIWMDIADEEKLIVVYPEGLNGAYGKPTWNDCRGNCTVSSDADDVRFLRLLTDTLARSFPIDSSRVYASGTSNGGLMALRLAVEAADRFAAVAAVAAAMPDTSECIPPAHPISVLFMNGTADNHLPYEGGTVSNPPKPSHGTVYSAKESVRIWTTVNQTDTIPAVYAFPDLDPADSSTVIRYTYANGVNGTEVILYKVIGGGHNAPSIKEQYSALFERYFGRQNHDIEMAREVWAFFKTKTLHGIE